MIWLTSDHHFGHRAVLGFCNRPWSNIAAMDAALIRNHNKMVAPTDIVYFLGDVSFHNKKKTRELLNRMNGVKRLVIGNHDPRWLKRMDVWDSWAYSTSLEVEGIFFSLAHYPPTIHSPGDLHTIYLHGHLHGHRLDSPPVMDVGVDANEYHPVGLPYLVKRVKIHLAGFEYLRRLKHAS